MVEQVRRCQRRRRSARQGQHRRTAPQPAPVLGDGDHLQALDRSPWRLSLGTDDRGVVGHSGAAGGRIFCPRRGSGVVGKIVVTFISPLIGRRTACCRLHRRRRLAALPSITVRSLTVLVLIILLCASTWTTAVLQPCALLDRRTIRCPNGRALLRLGQAANGVGKILTAGSPRFDCRQRGTLCHSLRNGRGVDARDPVPVWRHDPGRAVVRVLGVETHGVPIFSTATRGSLPEVGPRHVSARP